MRYIILFLTFSCLVSCATSSTTHSNTSSIYEDAYYEDLQKNIVRLHHLMQGTFTAHVATKADQPLTSWKVSEGDSVVLYSVPLGDPNKNGYWIYSYEFMTSLPDKPIYTSIKQLVQLNRDTVDVYYYKTKEPVTIRLADLLEPSQLTEKIDLSKLVKQEKRVRYARQSASHFIGLSLIYEDPDRGCLRQNTYDISPNFYGVKTNFYDKENQRILRIKKRPNLLVRRSIESRMLLKLSKQEEG